MKYSNEIVQAIKAHLENENMHLVAFDEDGDFGFVMHIPGPVSFVQYIIRVHEDNYTVTAIFPLSADSADDAAMSTVSEFITRANYGLKNGNFEMDYRDGEIRYKCHVHCGDQVPTEETIRNSVGVPAAMIKRYARGFIDILYKNISAKKAVEMCEDDEQALRRELADLSGLMKGALPDILKKRLEAQLDSDDDAEDSESSADGLPSFEDFLKLVSGENADCGDDGSAAEDDTISG